MVQTDLQKAWELRINDFRTSGLTQTKWCEVSNVKIFQFKYWLKKIEKKQEPSSKWIPITMESPFDESNDFLHIKIGKALLDVKLRVDPAFLAEVV